MKIIPNVTIQSFDKSGQSVMYPPLVEIDLAKDVAKDLIDRGFAVLAKDADTLDEPNAGPSVTSSTGINVTTLQPDQSQSGAASAATAPVDPAATVQPAAENAGANGGTGEAAAAAGANGTGKSA